MSHPLLEAIKQFNSHYSRQVRIQARGIGMGVELEMNPALVRLILSRGAGRGNRRGIRVVRSLESVNLSSLKRVSICLLSCRGSIWSIVRIIWLGCWIWIRAQGCRIRHCSWIVLREFLKRKIQKFHIYFLQTTAQISHPTPAIKKFGTVTTCTKWNLIKTLAKACLAQIKSDRIQQNRLHN